MKLFEVVPESFFRLLTGGNKQLNAEAVMLLYEHAQRERFGIRIELVRDLYQELIESWEALGVQLEWEDERTSDSSNAGQVIFEEVSRAKANALLRRLESLGWIEFETRDHYEVYIVLPHYTIRMLSLIQELCEGRAIEYQRYAFATYGMLSGQEARERPAMAVREALSNTVQFDRELFTLYNNMKHHIVNQRMIKFNPAAHEDAKRTLVDYLKGKIGSDERAYVRDGDFVSYLIVDKEKRESFVIGMVADVYYNLDHHEEFFILAPMTLEKLELMKPDGKLRNRDEFRRYYNGGSNVIKSVFEQNKSEYQKALLTRMGQVHDRFFQTFTRALSFKPIQNIRDFVYQNILDKRELQLDLMKENFEVHERYRLELQELQKRKGKLLQIREKFQTTERLRQTVTEQDYVIRCLRARKEQETLEDINGLLKQLEGKLERARQDLEWAEQKRTEASCEKADVSRRLYENTEERRKNELDQEIERYTGQKSGLENELRTWQYTMNKQAELLGRLAAWEGNEIWIWPTVSLFQKSSRSCQGEKITF